MDQLQQFTGMGTVYRSDGSALSGQRRYSITLVPWYDAGRPLAIDSWVELRDQEPLQLENEELTVQLPDDRWFTFRVIQVSETAPHHHTFVAQAWPTQRAG